MNRNIAFISNYNKTEFFSQVGKRLQEQGVGVYWFVVNSRCMDSLRKDYSDDRILYLGKDYRHKRNGKIGEFKLNELIHGDRTLRFYQNWATDYLINIQKPIYDFIWQNKIRLVLGEITWAHELLIHRICIQRKELECRFLNPHTVRIPNGRFAFFEDEFQSKIYKSSPIDQLEPSIRVQQNSIAVKIEKPDYLALNDKALKKASSAKARLFKVKRFITEENIDPNDPTLIPDRWIRFKVRVAEEINRELYRFVKRKSFADIKGKKYVYVALHKQPEASIDVMGRYYDDQLQNIINLWRIVPDDWFVVVKEHTNAIGDRPPKFYRALSRLKNVCLVNEKTDSHDLIMHSELVATVTGTVAYEAALMGKKSITFSQAFFNQFSGCRRIGLEVFRSAENIFGILPEVTGQDAAAVSERILVHTFEGIISDPVSNKACISSENIIAVSNAVKTVLKSLLEK